MSIKYYVVSISVGLILGSLAFIVGGMGYPTFGFSLLMLGMGSIMSIALAPLFARPSYTYLGESEVHHTHEHVHQHNHHNFNYTNVTEGVETTQHLPDGRSTITRHIKKWH